MYIYEVAILVGLIFLSAFFSGFESAILSLRLTRIRELVNKHVKHSKLVQKLKEKQHTTLITILIGNNIVNISASVLATKITLDTMARHGLEQGYILALATGVMTFIILTFGEITPKTVAIKNPEKYALLGSRLFYFFSVLLSPLIFVFDKISVLFIKIIGTSKEQTFYTSGEVKEFIQMSHERGGIQQNEKDFMTNVLDFNDTLVREIMTPLDKVIAIDSTKSLKELFETLVEWNFSRIPVYHEHIEEMIGVVYIKDVLPHIKRGETNMKVKDIMRSISHVPGVKKINSLFHYFKNKKEHIAVVINEYGNTLGIVTLEDVLEELVGEIQDESDDDTESQIKVIDKNTIMVPGTTNIEDIGKLLKVKIDDARGTFQTVAGYIFFHLGRIPKKGQVVNIDDLSITIIDVTHKKIDTVKIENKKAVREFDINKELHKLESRKKKVSNLNKKM
jgi:CBS domain containing-hemolysin-like protein